MGSLEASPPRERGINVDDVTGQDPDGNLSVTVDRGHRVVRFVVNRAEGVRTPAELETSARRAYRSALIAQVRDGEQPLSGQSPRTAVATPAMRVPRSRELLERHRIRGETAQSGERRQRTGAEAGHSDNNCVQVQLVTASSRGVIDADPGWLRQATASQVSQSVQQAFARAYEERDR